VLNWPSRASFWARFCARVFQTSSSRSKSRFRSRARLAKTLFVPLAAKEFLGFLAQVLEQVTGYGVPGIPGAQFAGKTGEVEEVILFEERRAHPALLFDAVAEADEEPIQRTDGPGQQIRGVIFRSFPAAAEQLLEEGGVVFDLLALVIVGADVHQIRGIGQSVLRDDVNVTPVKVGVARFAFRRDEAFAKDRVSRAESSRIGSSE
jgi:hypothetical protein